MVLVTKARQVPHVPPVSPRALQQPEQQAPLQQMLLPPQLVRLVIGLPPVHTPAWQVSPVVQALPSSQTVLSASGTQRPVAA